MTNIESLLKDHYRYSPSDHEAEEILLSRYVAGDLNMEERHKFEQHLTTCAQCGQLMRDYKGSEDAWAPPSLMQRIQDFLFSASSKRRYGAIAIAGVAVAMLVLVLRPASEVPRDSVGKLGSLRAKGGFSLHIAAKRAAQVFRIQDGDRLQDGDQLGFFYTSQQRGFFTLFHLDEVGVITRLVPAASETMLALDPATQAALPDGAILSAGTGCEWLVGFYAQQAIPYQRMIDSLKTSLDHRQGCSLPHMDNIPAQVQTISITR